MFLAASSNTLIESPGNLVPCEPNELMGFILMLDDAALLASAVAQSGSLNNGCMVFQCHASIIEICELYRREVLLSSLSLAERVKLPLTRLG